jgi:hypothetical protein
MLLVQWKGYSGGMLGVLRAGLEAFEDKARKQKQK